MLEEKMIKFTIRNDTRWSQNLKKQKRFAHKLEGQALIAGSYSSQISLFSFQFRCLTSN